MHIDRRRFLIGTMGLAGAAALGACSSDDDGSSGGGGGGADGASGTPADASSVLAEPGSAGLVDEAAYQARIEEYLRGATSELDPAGAVSIGTFLIAAHRDPEFTWEPTAVTVDTLQPVWDHIDEWRDTRDFQLMYLHWILALADGETEMRTIDPAVLAAIEDRMADNRYQWNDPLPDDRLDNLWFWSENHLIIGLVNEYLAGQRMPDRTFTITGLTGADHMERAKQPILDWVHERARFGFFEWHSHVYMKKNVAPLLTLVEFAEDPELVQAAAMGLDLCVLDMAGACHRATYSASRGRTYAKDKLTEREGTFDTFKLLFDDTDEAYGGGADSSASYFAGSTRYRHPQVLMELAVAPEPGVVRERHGIFVDGTAPVEDNPEAPFGYDFSDQKNLSFWWSQGAVGLWQVTDISLAAAEEFRLLETDLLADVNALVQVNGGDPQRVKEFVQANHNAVNFGHLREANTYSFRSDAVSLATVVDHRFGEMRDQIHTWEATLAPGAVVFTNHPRGDVPEEAWNDDAKPGYFTGEGSIPRSAQHERTGIHIYQPAWDAEYSPLLWGLFGYQDFTHAFVPQDRFDEVRQEGNWTFVSKDDGYIALWSWRTPEWRAVDPVPQPTADLVRPFDLVAPGGPDNVWIVEVGDTTTADSFDAFVEGVLAAEPEVERTDDGFTVAWTSPTSGEVTFGSTAPLTVDGEEIAIAEYPRHESMVGTVDHLATTFALAGEEAKLDLDFDAWTRTPASA